MNVKQSITITILFLLSIVVNAQSDLELAEQYYKKSDYLKAYEYYNTIKNSAASLRDYYEHYRESAIKAHQENEFSKSLKKISKQNPNEYLFKVDLALLEKISGNQSAYEQDINKLISSAAFSERKLSELVSVFSKRKLFNEISMAYLEARDVQNDYDLYAVELSNVYAYLGETVLMIKESIQSVINNKDNLDYAETLLSNQLKTEKDFDKFLDQIYPKIAAYPQLFQLNELLIWYYIQQKDFYNAFVEERSLDKKNLFLQGSRLVELGNLAFENKSYDESVEIFNYVLTSYPQSRFYFNIKQKLINIKELKLLATYPADSILATSLLKDYEELKPKARYPRDQLEIYSGEAMVWARYFSEYGKSMDLLNQALQIRGLTEADRARIKILKGDIYILLEEPWESTLLYYQAEKMVDGSEVSNEAKFKNTKLAYYRGDFELAKEQLDILKLSTSRDIANDAIDLAVLIQDNLALDTSDYVLSLYSKAEMYEYQQLYPQAYALYQKIVEQYNGHTLTDEALYKQAEILLKRKDYSGAVDKLNLLLKDYSEDIIGDKATYQLAYTYEYYLNDKTKAMEYYKKVLLEYPGSIYTSESRKKFRELRGDRL